MATFGETRGDRFNAALFMAIDFHTNETRSDTLNGNSYALDTLQLASTIGRQGVVYLPTISAIVRVLEGQ